MLNVFFKIVVKNKASALLQITFEHFWTATMRKETFGAVYKCYVVGSAGKDNKI